MLVELFVEGDGLLDKRDHDDQTHDCVVEANHEMDVLSPEHVDDAAQRIEEVDEGGKALESGYDLCEKGWGGLACDEMRNKTFYGDGFGGFGATRKLSISRT